MEEAGIDPIETSAAGAPPDDTEEPLPPIRIGVDEWCFHNSLMTGKMKLEDVISKAGELGAQGVGFDYFMMTREMRDDPARVRELLERNNLETAFGFGVPFALPDIVHQMLEGRKEEMFELAHEFGSRVIRVCGGVIIPNMFHKSFHVVLDREKEIQEVSRRLREFTEDAALEGLVVALENHSDYTVMEMYEIIDRVNNPNFKVTLDTGNAMYLKEDPVDTARRLAPYTAYTHIKDVARSGPFLLGAALGEGEVELNSIIQILRDHNYDGLFSIEVNLPMWKAEKEEEALAASMEYLRRYQ